MIADPGVDRADVDRPAGLEQDGPPGVGQPGHEREDLGLEQRLAAGDLDERRRPGRRARSTTSSSVEGLALVEGVRRVAIAAAEVAGGQPDEDAGQPGEGALALEAPVDLVDHQRPGRLARQRPEPLRARGRPVEASAAVDQRRVVGVVGFGRASSSSVASARLSAASSRSGLRAAG